MRLPCRFTNGTLGLRRLQLVSLARPFSVELCFLVPWWPSRSRLSVTFSLCYLAALCTSGCLFGPLGGTVVARIVAGLVACYARSWSIGGEAEWNKCHSSFRDPGSVQCSFWGPRELPLSLRSRVSIHSTSLSPSFSHKACRMPWQPW